MKSLLVVIAALAVGAARGAVTCDECRTAVQDFVSHLLSEEGITEQTEEMKSKVCPQVDTGALLPQNLRLFAAWPGRMRGDPGLVVPSHGQLYFQPFRGGS